MSKRAERYELSSFGRKILYVNGTVSVTNESVCQNPAGEAAIASARLYALTNLLSGQTGVEAFENLLHEEQQSIFDLLHGLAAEAAALCQLAQDIDCKLIKATPAIAEVCNG